MHKGSDRLEYVPGARGRHRAVCTCGGWEHDRQVDLDDERERRAAEAAFAEHQLQSVRG